MEFILHGLLWVALLPVHIGGVILKYPTAPVAVAFFTTEDGKHLDHPFKWLQTDDADLCGYPDHGWVTEHIEPGSDPCSYWNKTRWLWRNGLHNFNYEVLGIENDPAYSDDRLGWTIREDGYWLYREYFNIPTTNEHLEIFWGWNVYGNVNGLNKYTFTTRIQENK